MGSANCTKETEDLVNDFVIADNAFKAAWYQFEQQFGAQLTYIDSLREARNSKLDEAKRALRTEAEAADITKVSQLRAGPLMAQKKWTSFYSPEKFLQRLKDLNLYDSAITAKIVAEKVEFAKFEIVQQFLKMQGKEKEFEDCEDGNELTPAIGGAKPIPPFGVEFKEGR